MNTNFLGLAVVLIAALAPTSVAAFGHAGRFGGSTFHSGGFSSHTNAWGGSTEHAFGEGTEHTNMYGGSTEHAWGGGTEHTNVYGGTTAGALGAGVEHTTPYGATTYRSPYYGGTYPAYHPPTTVNYYGAGCYSCGGWAVAGAVATGAVIGAAAASANTATAYSAGYAAGAQYAMGGIYPSVPSGCATPDIRGTTYYLCGNTWFQPAFGANGVYYRVVAPP